MPEVSIIIPNYNHAEFITQRIDSVINQTYQDVEVIILDDCSTDNSRLIIEQYRNHPKITGIIYNEHNSGSPFKQWEKGIELAKGTFVWIAESDDWCESFFLENLMQHVNKKTCLAFSQVMQVTGEKIRWIGKAEQLEMHQPGVEFVKSRMLWLNAIPNASACIFRRSSSRQIDESYLSYRFCGDWQFWISVAMQGEVFVSGKVLSYFRKHGNDVSGGAYATGIYYDEYFKLTDRLVANKIIGPAEQRELLYYQFYESLDDKRLGKTVRSSVRNRFASRLGNGIYLKWFKHEFRAWTRKRKVF